MAAFAVTALVMYLLFRELAGLEASASALRKVDWSLSPWPLALLAATVLISVSKWRFVLRRMGYEVPYRTSLAALLAAWPFAAITPSRAGDFMRCAGIRAYVPWVPGGASILVDRLFDVQSLVLLALAGALLQGWWAWAAGLSCGLVIAWGVGLWVLGHRAALRRLRLSDRLLGTIENLADAIMHVVHSPRASLTLTAWSLLNWVAVQAIFVLLLRMCGVDLAATTATTLWPIATFIGLIPLTLAGMGTRDLTFIYFVHQATGIELDYGPTLLATFGYSLFSAWILAVIGTPFTIHMLLANNNKGSKARDSDQLAA